MQHKDFDTSGLWKSLSLLLGLLVFLVFGFGLYLVFGQTVIAAINQPEYSEEHLAAYTNKREKLKKQERYENWDLIEKGIHVKTGFIADENLDLVIASCTPCHSAKLITQNRASRQGWKDMIEWMYATQGLNDLGSKEPIILDYLAKHYAPQAVGRRANLDMAAIEWYILELGEISD